MELSFIGQTEDMVFEDFPLSEGFAVLTSIAPDSPVLLNASDVILTGDAILSVNGFPVETVQSFSHAVKSSVDLVFEVVRVRVRACVCVYYLVQRTCCLRVCEP